jgi:hypothetical protein
MDNKDGSDMSADGFQERSNTYVDEFKEGIYMTADGFQDGINVSVTSTRKMRACCSVIQNRRIKIVTDKKIQLR